MKRYIGLLFCLFSLLAFSACQGEELPNTTSPGTSLPDSFETETTSEITSETEVGSEASSAIPQTTEYASEQQNPTITNPSSVPVDSPTENTSSENDGKTFTGRPALPLADFKSFDPNNKKGLPTKKIAHAYGVAKDEKPHSISVENQKFFDTKGYDALAYDAKTKEKILYLTFDCGYENGYTSKILDTLKAKGVKAAFFCTLPQMRENPDLIARMINEGHIVGNHSNRHPSFPDISRTRMAEELQAFDDYLRTNFGYSSPVFRFPMGEYSESALDLVESLGYKSVFWSAAYSDWDLNNQKGKEYALNTVTSRLHPGAVILLHSVSPDNAAAMGDIIDWAKDKGYSFKELL